MEETTPLVNKTEVTTTPVVESTAQTATEPKKKNGCLTGCLITLAVILVILGVLVGAGYLGYKKVISMAGPVDLGVTYTQQDYIDAMDNANFTIDDYNKLALDKEYPTFSDPQQLEVNITGAQASAWIDTVNKNLTYGSIENTQIKFGEDGAEVSTLFTYEGKTIPVYLSGNVYNTSATTVGGTIDTIKAGPVSVPSSVIEFAQNALTQLANEKLSSLGDTLRIDTLEISNGALHFDGLFPTEAN
jgi:hypothetical protein